MIFSGIVRGKGFILKKIYCGLLRTVLVSLPTGLVFLQTGPVFLWTGLVFLRTGQDICTN